MANLFEQMIDKVKTASSTTPASTPIVTTTAPSLFSMIPTWIWVIGIGGLGFLGYKRFIKKK